MKSRHVVPTGTERPLPPDRYIVSTTDRSGRITSVNDLFTETSLYTPDELLGAQHNLVRHPDMPRTIFWMAWDALLADEDFFGYMKNLCKDGSHYWVFSHIRPQHDGNGNITGFRSVRRRALPEAIVKVAALYASMLAAEQAAGTQHAIEAGLGVLKDHLAGLGTSYERFVASLASQA